MDVDLLSEIKKIEAEVRAAPYISEYEDESLNRLIRWGENLLTFPLFSPLRGGGIRIGNGGLNGPPRVLGEWVELFFRMGHSSERFLKAAKRFMRENKWRVLDIRVVQGVAVERAQSLGKGISLRPVEDLPPQYWRDRLFSPITAFSLPWRLHATALVREIVVSNVIFSDVNDPRIDNYNSISAPIFMELNEETEAIRLCLGLASGNAVEFIGNYMTADPLVSPPPTTGLQHTMRWYPIMGVRVDSGRASRFIRQARSMNERAAWQLGVDRLLRSRGPLNEVDPVIDLGMAAEILLMHNATGGGGDGKGEVRNKIATRGAWLAGHDLDERTELAQVLGKIYDARSRAVHTGAPPKKPLDRYPNVADRAVAQVAIALLARGGFPNWQQLVLGGDRAAKGPDDRARNAAALERARQHRAQHP